MNRKYFVETCRRNTENCPQCLGWTRARWFPSWARRPQTLIVLVPFLLSLDCASFTVKFTLLHLLSWSSFSTRPSPGHSRGSPSHVLTRGSAARTRRPSAPPGTGTSHTCHCYSRVRFLTVLYPTFPATAGVISFGFPWPMICINSSESHCQFSSPFIGTATNFLILDGFS